MFGRLLGRAWGGHGPSRFIVVAGLLFGGWLLFAHHGDAWRPVVPAKPQQVDRNWLWEKTPDIAPAAPPARTAVRPALCSEESFLNLALTTSERLCRGECAGSSMCRNHFGDGASQIPAYSYPVSTPPAYFVPPNYYARPMQPMWPQHYAFAGHAFGGFGHFGHGGHR